MAASDHLSPYQFSQHEDRVVAHAGDEHVGHLVWATGHKFPFDLVNDQVNDVWVHPEHRHKGIATSLWNQAKTINPRIRHSDDRTEDGHEWSETLK